MSVVVLGSINIDLVATVDRFPQVGETRRGDRFFEAAGGKGANQAVAAAKLGAETYFVGRVGGDDYGDRSISSLKAAGVRTDGVFIDSSTHSGVAVITVNNEGDNTIISVRGTNANVGAEDIDRLRQVLPGATAFLVQLEIPLDAVVSGIRAASDAGVTVILDPAPAIDLPSEIYPYIDIITPNEGEASALTGVTVSDAESAEKAADILRDRGVKTAIVTLGKQGLFCASESDRFFLPAYEVEAVDTVAAGDAFNGGLAAAIDAGEPLKEAVRKAAATAAFSVTRSGAQPSLPTRSQRDRFCRDR